MSWALSLAGFQVTRIGRFWVTPEKPVKNALLSFIEFGDASQPDLSPFDRRQHDINTVDGSPSAVSADA